MKRLNVELCWGRIRSLRCSMSGALTKSLSTDARHALRLLDEQLPLDATIPGVVIADTQKCPVEFQFTEPQIKILLEVLRSVPELAGPLRRSIAN